MKDGIRDSLVFSVKDLRHETDKAYAARVLPESLGLTYEEARFTMPLACKVGISRHSGDNIYVTTHVETRLRVECRRCVKPVEVEVTTNVDLLFSMGADPEAAAEDGERYYDGETLDISEDIRRSLVLEIPTWPLCTEACKGLCTACGTDLNAADCACTHAADTETAASPFSVLAKMLEKN